MFDSSGSSFLELGSFSLFNFIICVLDISKLYSLSASLSIARLAINFAVSDFSPDSSVTTLSSVNLISEAGDTILKFLNRLKTSSSNFEVVKTTFMQGITSDCVVMPCETVDNPYVQLEQFGDRISVKFSKYNEPTNKGFHDLSLFFGDACYIRDCLEEYKRQIFKSGNYVHKHGNEMEFLDLFNEVDMKGTIIPITYHSCFSFNKMSEFKHSTCILDDDIL